MSTINFLREREGNILDKIIQWMLSYGRTIVMFTYLIALLAFLYRFTIDYQISNLHDQITKNAQIINASKTNEASYRDLQNRLAAITTLDKQGKVSVKHIEDIIGSSNGNVTFNSVNFSNASVQATVTTNSTQGLNTFIAAIRNLPYVTSVDISSIENKLSTGQIIATLAITLQSTGQATTPGAQ